MSQQEPLTWGPRGGVPPFIGHPLCHTDGCNAAGLGADDAAAGAMLPLNGILQKILRHLRRKDVLLRCPVAAAGAMLPPNGILQRISRRLHCPECLAWSTCLVH